MLLALSLACGRARGDGDLGFLPSDATNAYRMAEMLVTRHVPRDAGTPRGAAAARAILGRLVGAGHDARLDVFEERTSAGRRKFANVLCEIRSRPKDPWVVLLSHYDTKRDVPMPGANDGASTTGLLAALADAVARSSPRRLNVLCVWTDGEECVRKYAPDDGLHGSRHAAKALRESGRTVRAVVCLDMLGDRDLGITVPSNGDAGLKRMVAAAARESGVPVVSSPCRVTDDHVPFAEAGFPAVDLIDFAYGSVPGANDYWHTPADSMDKISVGSLFKSGSLVAALLRLLR